MTRFTPLFALAGLVAAAPLAANAPAPIAGRWQSPSDSVVVEVAPCGSAFCGTVVSATAKAKADARKGGTASLVGTRLMTGFKPAKPNEWEDGRIYDPSDGSTYHAEMRLENPNSLRLRGYVLLPLLGKSQVWTRVAGDYQRCSAG